MIGTVSTNEKEELAKANGYHHVINYSESDFVTAVQKLTDGEGVDVVYDSIGQDTYPASLNCLKRLGMWVCFGQSSGPAEDFKISDLAVGSLYLTRPTLFHFVADREWLEKAAAGLFEMISSGKLKIAVNQTFDLSDAAKAHEALESRATTGSTVLIP